MYLDDQMRAFLQAVDDGEFDLDQEEDDYEADEDEVLEQTIRDYNDSVCQVGY